MDLEYTALQMNLAYLKKLTTFINTGRERLIRSHSSARFCFELSRNSN